MRSPVVCAACCMIVTLAVLIEPPPARSQTVILKDRPIPLPEPPPGIRPRPIPRPGPVRFDQCLPIADLSIAVSIVDGVAVTRVDQTFRNPYNATVEGTYIFPLEDDVALSNFTMSINGKQITGQLLDADEASKIYENIVRRMRDPGLLEYVGTRMFKASLFPIQPRSKVRVTLSYTQLLRSDAGIARYHYPLSTERFVPSPVERLTFLARIESKTPIKSVFSPSHKIAVTRESAHKATASLEAEHAVPTRNLDLFYALSDERFGLTVLTYREPGEDGYFVARVSPGARVDEREVIAKDIAFVIDTSSSMSGEKIEQARKALTFCLQHLRKKDRFNIIAFSHEPRRFAKACTPVTDEQREAGLKFVKGIEAIGGTNINDALLAALEDAPADDSPRTDGDASASDDPASGSDDVAKRPERDTKRPYYIVFLTDGMPTIGEIDTKRILINISKANRGRARLFCFGVGYDVNTRLLDLLAEQNRGTREYVEPGEDLELALSSFYRKIADPVLSDVSLRFANLDVHDLYPPKPGDLFGGSELVVVGRYAGAGPRAVELAGMRSGERLKHIYETTFPERDGRYEFLPRLWATRKVGYLLDQARLHGADAELKAAIVKLAKQYGIITPYTSYLVTEPMRVAGRTPGGPDVGRSVFPPTTRYRGRAATAEMDAATRASLESLGYLETEDSLDNTSFETDNGVLFDQSARVSKRKQVRRSKEAKALQQGLFNNSGGLDVQGSAASAKGRGSPAAKSGVVRQVGTRTFYRLDGQWIDGAYDGKAKTRRLELFSKAYFDLIRKHKDLGKCFALGKRVIVMVGKVAYETVPEPKSDAEPKQDAKPAGKTP